MTPAILAASSNQWVVDSAKLAWSDGETEALLDIWGSEEIQENLKGCTKNKHIFIQIAQVMAGQGYLRSPEQCQTRIKRLRANFRHFLEGRKWVQCRGGGGCGHKDPYCKYRFLFSASFSTSSWRALTFCLVFSEGRSRSASTLTSWCRYLAASTYRPPTPWLKKPILQVSIMNNWKSKVNLDSLMWTLNHQLCYFVSFCSWPPEYLTQMLLPWFPLHYWISCLSRTNSTFLGKLFDLDKMCDTTRETQHVD